MSDFLPGLHCLRHQASIHFPCMARSYDEWPWFQGDCSACPHHFGQMCNGSPWVVKCSKCNLNFCEEWSVDGCANCGFPFCSYCYRDHLCVNGALLVKFPEFQCRFCELPQDRGNGLNRCSRCHGCECVAPNGTCDSLLNTTHCCHIDMCGACAAWQQTITSRTVNTGRRWTTRTVGIPLPRLSRQWICEQCLPKYRVQASDSSRPISYPHRNLELNA